MRHLVKLKYKSIHKSNRQWDKLLSFKREKRKIPKRRIKCVCQKQN